MESSIGARFVFHAHPVNGARPQRNNGGEFPRNVTSEAARGAAAAATLVARQLAQSRTGTRQTAVPARRCQWGGAFTREGAQPPAGIAAGACCRGSGAHLVPEPGIEQTCHGGSITLRFGAKCSDRIKSQTGQYSRKTRRLLRIEQTQLTCNPWAAQVRRPKKLP